MVISLTGFMGCGKSSVGRELARMLGADYVDLDLEIVRCQDRPIPDIFREGGEDLFRRIEFEVLESVLDTAPIDRITVLSLGGGAVTRPEALEAILSRTKSVYLRTRMDTIRRRIGESDPNRPLFRDPLAAEALYASRVHLYEQASVIVDTDGRSLRELAELIAAELGL